jgi:hypothetical protein
MQLPTACSHNLGLIDWRPSCVFVVLSATQICNSVCWTVGHWTTGLTSFCQVIRRSNRYPIASDGTLMIAIYVLLYWDVLPFIRQPTRKYNENDVAKLAIPTLTFRFVFPPPGPCLPCWSCLPCRPCYFWYGIKIDNNKHNGLDISSAWGVEWKNSTHKYQCTQLHSVTRMTRSNTVFVACPAIKYQKDAELAKRQVARRLSTPITNAPPAGSNSDGAIDGLVREVFPWTSGGRTSNIQWKHNRK